MTLLKSFSLKLITFTLCLSLSSCAYGQKSKTTTNSDTKTESNTAETNIKNLLKKQVLLTNSAKFTNDRIMEGASGFLIKYNGATFAVTARHLLGEDGGVEPEVKINDLGKSLISWEMMPRIISNANKETVKLEAKGLDFSKSEEDIVLLKILSKDFEIETLIPKFDYPKDGETLYLIGCPYSQTKCRQNFYEVDSYGYNDENKRIIGEIKSKDDLRGFSGAPLVNSKGEVVGVLVGGGESEGKNFVTATPINEIQKIKF
jgi:hypothetical protein